MLIKKGPFGYFAVERFDSPESIFSYAGEVIDRNRSECLLPCSIDMNGITSSAYFDFSGLISVRQSGSVLLHGSHRSKKMGKILGDRRKSAGDFFCLIPKLLDNLISPSAIVLDPEYVFTDENGSCIKFCLLPCKSAPDLLRLSSLGSERLERFLSEPFFDEVLTNDEKQELIFSVKTDNEVLFLKCARQILESENTYKNMVLTPATGSANAPRHLPDRHSKRQSSSNDAIRPVKVTAELIWSCICSLAAAAALRFSGLVPSLLFIVVSGVFLAVFFIKRRTKKDSKETGGSELASVRRMIFFSDADEAGKSTYKEETPGGVSEPSHSVTPLFTGTLTSFSETDGKPLSYSVMMDKTTIGSDVFLSDIVIDDPSVDALHAIIYLSGNTFYISDCSRKGTTYIDDRKTATGRKCEIKNGQKITIGTIDFRFKVLFPSAGQAWSSESPYRSAQ